MMWRIGLGDPHRWHWDCNWICCCYNIVFWDVHCAVVTYVYVQCANANANAMYNMQSSLWNAYCAYYALYNVWSALWVVGRPVLIEIHSRPHNWSIWDRDLCELNIAPASKMDRAHYSLPINHLRMDVALWCCKWTGLDGIGYLWVGEVKTKSTLRCW